MVKLLTSEEFINESVLNIIYGTKLSYSRTTEYPEHIEKKDLDLIEKLILRGSSHCKGLRMLNIILEITAPRYWWSEFDTYKIGTVALSESTMHTLKKNQLSQSDFIHPIPESLLWDINELIESGAFVGYIKSLLPEGYLQTRVVSLNYQVLRSIYSDRRNHLLPEWVVFCNYLEGLPYARFITISKE